MRSSLRSLRQHLPRLFLPRLLLPSLFLPSLFLPLLLALGASPSTAVAGQVAPSAAARADGQVPLELVESWPEETTLDHPDLRDAKDVWPELFAAARSRIDVAEFYLDSAPGSALERSVLALEAAAGRGVRVRLLCDEKFYKNYPATADRLGEAGVDVRRIDYKKVAGGVLVELLVSHWSLRKGTVEGLQRLEREGAGAAGKGSLHVRIMTIPEAKAGYLPYARVVHAKYLVIDGARAWVGTSNWEPDYFYASRNVGLVIEGGALPRRLDRFFLDGWDGAYARPLDPDASFPSPRTGP